MPNTKPITVLAALALASAMGQAQEGGFSGALEQDVRAAAFRSNAPDPGQILSSIVLTFEPPARPESRIIIYFERGAKVEVTILKADVSLWDAIRPVLNAASINKNEVAKVMNVKQTHFAVDQATALDWLQGLQAAIKESLNLAGDQDHTVQLDGTLYQLQYRAQSSIMIEVPGPEIGAVTASAPPVVRWMDAVRRSVEAIPLK